MAECVASDDASARAHVSPAKSEDPIAAFQRASWIYMCMEQRFVRKEAVPPFLHRSLEYMRKPNNRSTGRWSAKRMKREPKRSLDELIDGLQARCNFDLRVQRLAPKSPDGCSNFDRFNDILEKATLPLKKELSSSSSSSCGSGSTFTDRSPHFVPPLKLVFESFTDQLCGVDDVAKYVDVEVFLVKPSHARSPKTKNGHNNGNGVIQAPLSNGFHVHTQGSSPSKSDQRSMQQHEKRSLGVCQVYRLVDVAQNGSFNSLLYDLKIACNGNNEFYLSADALSPPRNGLRPNAAYIADFLRDAQLEFNVTVRANAPGADRSLRSLPNRKAAAAASKQLAAAILPGDGSLQMIPNPASLLCLNGSGGGKSPAKAALLNGDACGSETSSPSKDSHDGSCNGSLHGSPPSESRKRKLGGGVAKQSCGKVLATFSGQLSLFDADGQLCFDAHDIVRLNLRQLVDSEEDEKHHVTDGAASPAKKKQRKASEPNVIQTRRRSASPEKVNCAALNFRVVMATIINGSPLKLGGVYKSPLKLSPTSQAPISGGIRQFPPILTPMISLNGGGGAINGSCQISPSKGCTSCVGCCNGSPRSSVASSASSSRKASISLLCQNGGSPGSSIPELKPQVISPGAGLRLASSLGKRKLLSATAFLRKARTPAAFFPRVVYKFYKRAAVEKAPLSPKNGSSAPGKPAAMAATIMEKAAKIKPRSPRSSTEEETDSKYSGASSTVASSTNLSTAQCSLASTSSSSTATVGGANGEAATVKEAELRKPTEMSIVTKPANRNRCPWCHVPARSLFSLLKHLRCYHPRFDFTCKLRSDHVRQSDKGLPEAKFNADDAEQLAEITVRLSRTYDASYERLTRRPNNWTRARISDVIKAKTEIGSSPKNSANQRPRRSSATSSPFSTPPPTVSRDLCGGRAVPRKTPWPVREVSAQEILVTKLNKQRISWNLAEFVTNAPEDLIQPVTVFTAGHTRQYFHTDSLLPMLPEELDTDSEAGHHTDWLHEYIDKMIDDFTDVNRGEKIIAKAWDHHVVANHYYAKCHMRIACETFIAKHAAAFWADGLSGNLLLHLVSLLHYGAISPLDLHELNQQFRQAAPSTSPPSA